MGDLKLPKPFHQIIDGCYRIRWYRIMEAYVDRRDYPNSTYDNLGDLREYLNLDDSDSVCDCFCKVSIVGEGEKMFIFEDKNSKHSRDIFTAKKQLEITNKNLIGKRKNIDYAIVCNIHLEPSFETRTVVNYPAKALYSVMNRSKQFHLEGKNLKGEKIPLLYYKG